MSSVDDIQVSSGQLNGFKESVTDLKCLLKVEVTSFCFDNNLTFSSNIIFYCILPFLFEKYGLYAFQNGLELQSTLSFSNYFNLPCLFRFCHLVLLSLKFDNVNNIFRLISLAFCFYIKITKNKNFFIPS